MCTRCSLSTITGICFFASIKSSVNVCTKFTRILLKLLPRRPSVGKTEKNPLPSLYVWRPQVSGIIHIIFHVRFQGIHNHLFNLLSWLQMRLSRRSIYPYVLEMLIILICCHGYRWDWGRGVLPILPGDGEELAGWEPGIHAVRGPAKRNVRHSRLHCLHDGETRSESCQTSEL